MSRKTSLYVLTLLVVLAFALGALVWGGRPDLTAAERERERIRNDALRQKLELDVGTKATLQPFIVAAKVVGGALVLASVAGAVFVCLRWLDRRAAEIRPGPDGQYPVVRLRVAGAMVIHDPNRQLAAAVVYARPEQANRVLIQPVITGQLTDQERTTARAQAVQLAAAVHRHPPLLAPGRNGDQRPHIPELTAGDAAETPAWPWPAEVPLPHLLRDQTPSLHRLALGLTIDPATGGRDQVTGDLSQLVHVAIGGSSGWGKSVFLRALTYQLATCPERPDLALLDLEGVTLAPFARSGRLLYPIAETERDALATCRALADELDRRKALFSALPGVDSLTAYNAQADEPLAPLVVVIDEATALLADKSVESALRTLALRGRKYGLWLILGGQDWKASSLDTAIRNQLSARIQFRAMSASQSRVLLEQAGAETLAVPGRALAMLPGRGLVEFQAPIVRTPDIVAALDGSGPRHAMPSDDDQDQDEQIRRLAAEGLSKRAIQERVFGYTGGAAYTAVTRVLEQ